MLYRKYQKALIALSTANVLAFILLNKFRPERLEAPGSLLATFLLAVLLSLLLFATGTFLVWLAQGEMYRPAVHRVGMVCLRFAILAGMAGVVVGVALAH